MKLTKVIAALVFLGVTATASNAQTTDAHDVTIVVPTVNMIAVSGDLTLTLGQPAAPGGDPAPATSTGAQYLVTTNETGKKITAALSSNYSTGITLAVELIAVGSATSAGQVTLSATAVDVVTGIGLVSGSAAINYTASATSAVAPGSETRTVTYTLTS